MDLPAFLLGLLPVVAVGFAGIVAFRRRRDRDKKSPLILNPYTLAVEPDDNALGHLPIVQPAPGVTTSQRVDVPGPSNGAGRLAESDQDRNLSAADENPRPS